MSSEDRHGARAAAGPGNLRLAVASGGTRRGRWLVLGAAFFWGTSATLARHLFRDHHVPALQVVEVRLTIASLLLGGWLALRSPERLRIEWRDLPDLVVLGLFGVAAVQGSYYYAVSSLGVGLAILLQYIAPALILLYTALRGEHLPPLAIIAVLAAIAGTALLVWNTNSQIHAPPLAWAVGFGSAFIFAFYIVFSKRALRRHRAETVLFYTFAIASLFWWLIIPPWTIVNAHYGRDLWLLFAVLGIGSTLIPFGLFYAGLRTLDPPQAGILATAEPVIAVLSAWLLLGESLHPVQWLGAALVLAASAIASNTPERVIAEAERA